MRVESSFLLKKRPLKLKWGRGYKGLLMFFLFLSFYQSGFSQNSMIVLRDSQVVKGKIIAIPSDSGYINFERSNNARFIQRSRIPLSEVSYVLHRDETLELFYEEPLPPKGPMPLGMSYDELMFRKLPLSCRLFLLEGNEYPEHAVQEALVNLQEGAEAYRRAEKLQKTGKGMKIGGGVGMCLGIAFVVEEAASVGFFSLDLGFGEPPDGDYGPGLIAMGAGLAAVFIGEYIYQSHKLDSARAARLYNREVYRKYKAKLEVAPISPAGPGLSLLLSF